MTDIFDLCFSRFMRTSLTPLSELARLAVLGFIGTARAELSRLSLSGVQPGNGEVRFMLADGEVLVLPIGKIDAGSPSATVSAMHNKVAEDRLPESGAVPITMPITIPITTGMEPGKS